MTATFGDIIFFFGMALIINAIISYLIASSFEQEPLKRDSNILDLIMKSQKEELLKHLKGFLKFISEEAEDECLCGECDKEEDKKEVKKEPVRRKPKAGDIVKK